MLHVFPRGPTVLVSFSSHSSRIFSFSKKKKAVQCNSGKSSCLTDYFNLQTWSCAVRQRWAVLWRIRPGCWQVSLSAASPSGARRQPTLIKNAASSSLCSTHTQRAQRSPRVLVHFFFFGFVFIWLFFFACKCGRRCCINFNFLRERGCFYVRAHNFFVWPGWAFHWATATRLVLGCREKKTHLALRVVSGALWSLASSSNCVLESCEPFLQFGIDLFVVAQGFCILQAILSLFADAFRDISSSKSYTPNVYFFAISFNLGQNFVDCSGPNFMKTIFNLFL